MLRKFINYLFDGILPMIFGYIIILLIIIYVIDSIFKF